jgi:hypothetical protein
MAGGDVGARWARRFGPAVAGLLALGMVLLPGVLDARTLPPRGKRALLRWLSDGTYAHAYTPEPAIHPSTPAHGTAVRTYLSPRLVDDLRAGRPQFRRGAAMVKEIYRGGTLVGWAVMRKLRRRSGTSGRGWLFYETLDGTNRGAIIGRGPPVCTGCHGTGQDFLLSSFRP